MWKKKRVAAQGDREKREDCMLKDRLSQKDYQVYVCKTRETCAKTTIRMAKGDKFPQLRRVQ